MDESDISYLRRRAAEEDAAARGSRDRAIAAVHRAMAIAYLQRVVELSEGARRIDA